MYSKLTGILPAFLCVLVFNCGPKKVVRPMDLTQTTRSDWTYISELYPIKEVFIDGDTLIAFNGRAMIKAPVSGGLAETINLNLPEKDAARLDCFLADSGGGAWVAGGNKLFRITTTSIEEINEIQLLFTNIRALAGSSGKRVFVGGNNRLAALEAGTWSVYELPFHVTGAITSGDRVFFMAGEKGLASIKGDSITEYPNPLLKVKAHASSMFTPLSMVLAGEQLWVLWTGDGSYLSVLDFASNESNAYTFEAGQIGLPQQLFEAGGKVYLQTEHGIFLVHHGQVTGLPLKPLAQTAELTALTYKITPYSIYGESSSGFSGIKPFTFTPVPRGPLKGPEKIEIEEDKYYTLTPKKLKTRSDITVLKGWKDFFVAGTHYTGISVLGSDGMNMNEVYLYDAKPRVPFSILSSKNGELLYPLESGEMGMLKKGRLFKIKAGDQAGEKAQGVHRLSDRIYSITLKLPEESVHIYNYVGGSFEKLYDRTVDLATGIGSIGSFAISPDNTFWFTIRSYGEGQEMGAAELRPAMEELILDGSVPVPPEHALIIPNGVSSILAGDDGTIYLGGMDGLVIVSPDRSIKKYRESEGLVGDFVTDMALDRDGTLWLVTVEGLGWLKDGKLAFPTEAPYRGAGVACVGTSNDGRALVIDEDGLKRRDKGKWVILGSRGEIIGAPILDVQADGLGNIWVVTKRAISIFKEM